MPRKESLTYDYPADAQAKAEELKHEFLARQSIAGFAPSAENLRTSDWGKPAEQHSGADFLEVHRTMRSGVTWAFKLSLGVARNTRNSKWRLEFTVQNMSVFGSENLRCRIIDAQNIEIFDHVEADILDWLRTHETKWLELRERFSEFSKATDTATHLSSKFNVFETPSYIAVTPNTYAGKITLDAELSLHDITANELQQLVGLIKRHMPDAYNRWTGRQPSLPLVPLPLVPASNPTLSPPTAEEIAWVEQMAEVETQTEATVQQAKQAKPYDAETLCTLDPTALKDLF